MSIFIIKGDNRDATFLLLLQLGEGVCLPFLTGRLSPGKIQTGQTQAVVHVTGRQPLLIVLRTNDHISI